MPHTSAQHRGHSAPCGAYSRLDATSERFITGVGLAPHARFKISQQGVALCTGVEQTKGNPSLYWLRRRSVIRPDRSHFGRALARSRTHVRLVSTTA
ncbi:hypothetical protein PoB_003000200 [Plakobranchus ocellatus]|uniref:Uncharacterized protein n=1 Tax=Plakobranchus ocellatus TaxID=259542 RepID=A0AAV4A964_9GAST|nr:hypothetical protein PoB_003000200 [Plakobranchus ocellatus]